MNKFGIDLNSYKDNLQRCSTFLSNNLRQGCLGLMLGAGVSYDLDLPGWIALVEKCLNEITPGTIVPSSTDNSELKRISNQISSGRTSKEYFEIVKRCLYDGVVFDFGLAKKNLLIALSSLMVGKTRGNVNHIVTYNFDSVLEWYLHTVGLKINVSRKSELLLKNADVEITHLHGYIPHDPLYGEDLGFLVFTKREFENRMVQYDYWKVFMQEFYRRHLFLAVGMSPQSLIDDVCPYLRELDESFYKRENILRDFPYGVAFITPNSNPNEDREQKEELLEHGIIPCTIDIPNIPNAIFEVAQNANPLF